MRKAIVVVFMLLLLTVGACGQEQMYYFNEGTFAWEDDGLDADGNPFEDTDVIEYEVFIFDKTLTIDDQDIGNLTYLGLTSETQLDLSLLEEPPDAEYYIGVRQVVTRLYGEVYYSEIAWSYDETRVAENPFFYRVGAGFLNLKALTGLSGMKM